VKGGASSRDRMLGFLRSRAPRAAGPAMGADGLFARREPVAPSAGGESFAERRARFAQSLRKAGGEVHDLVGSPDPRAQLVLLAASLRPEPAGAPARPRAALDRDPAWEILRTRSGGRLDMRGVLEEAGFDCEVAPVEGGEGAPGNLTVELLAEAALGVTLADRAVAETGSIVQVARPFRPRSISLLPPAHLVVLPEERIAADLEELFDLLTPELASQAGYLTLITGPSRTADIEKVLTIGVHGPGRLLVALVEGG
jgi:hypothetical protein